MTRKERLTSMFQDFALVLGLYLALVFAGAKFEWYHWAIILVALITLGAKSTINGIKSGVMYSIGHMAHMPSAERDKLYKEHLAECKATKED